MVEDALEGVAFNLPCNYEGRQQWGLDLVWRSEDERMRPLRLFPAHTRTDAVCFLNWSASPLGAKDHCQSPRSGRRP